MDVIRHAHSCIRLERRGQVLVIDPGVWADRQVLDGADAVLVTHEHADYVDEAALAEAGIPVYARLARDSDDSSRFGSLPGRRSPQQALVCPP